MGLPALLFGVAIAIASAWRAAYWPATTLRLYRSFGLSLAAWVVRPWLHPGGVWGVITLNILWGLGYGWLMPLVVHALTTS